MPNQTDNMHMYLVVKHQYNFERMTSEHTRKKVWVEWKENRIQQGAPVLINIKTQLPLSLLLSAWSIAILKKYKHFGHTGHNTVEENQVHYIMVHTICIFYTFIYMIFTDTVNLN